VFFVVFIFIFCFFSLDCTVSNNLIDDTGILMSLISYLAMCYICLDDAGMFDMKYLFWKKKIF